MDSLIQDVPLTQMSRLKIRGMNPFRDDPKCVSTGETKSKGTNNGKITTDVSAITNISRVDSVDHCKCGLCKPMPSVEESICCTEVKINQELMIGLECICNHPLVTSILDRQILTIQLLTLWDATRSSADVGNKNLRFAAYRSLYFWIYGKRSPSTPFRRALPACLVSLIRQKYPDEHYTGFRIKLPVPKRKHKGGQRIQASKKSSQLPDTIPSHNEGPPFSPLLPQGEDSGVSAPIPHREALDVSEPISRRNAPDDSAPISHTEASVLTASTQHSIEPPGPAPIQHSEAPSVLVHTRDQEAQSVSAPTSALQK